MADEEYEHHDGIIISDPIYIETARSYGKYDRRRVQKRAFANTLIVGEAECLMNGHGSNTRKRLVLAIPNELHHIALDVDAQDMLWSVLNKRRKARRKWRRELDAAVKEREAHYEAVRAAARAAQQETVDA